MVTHMVTHILYPSFPPLSPSLPPSLPPPPSLLSLSSSLHTFIPSSFPPLPPFLTPSFPPHSLPRSLPPSSLPPRYTNTLLKRVAAGGICYSKSRKCFVSRVTLPFKAEEFTDIKELQALAEVIGPYGIRFMGEKLMEQVSGQVRVL